MARKAKRESAPSPTAPSDRVGVKSANEQWSIIDLDDGTTLEIRPAIVEVRRLRNKFNDDGSPIYALKTVMLTNTISPKRLSKKVAKKSTKKKSAKKK